MIFAITGYRGSDLAIKSISQNDTFARLAQKANRYRKSGVREVWVLDIESRQTFLYSDHRNAILDDNELFASELIPGFSIVIGDLFDRR